MNNKLKLTPCRQMGLSRKIKPKQSLFSTPTSEELKSSGPSDISITPTAIKNTTITTKSTPLSSGRPFRIGLSRHINKKPPNFKSLLTSPILPQCDAKPDVSIPKKTTVSRNLVKTLETELEVPKTVSSTFGSQEYNEFANTIQLNDDVSMSYSPITMETEKSKSDSVVIVTKTALKSKKKSKRQASADLDHKIPTKLNPAKKSCTKIIQTSEIIDITTDHIKPEVVKKILIGGKSYDRKQKDQSENRTLSNKLEGKKRSLKFSLSLKKTSTFTKCSEESDDDIIQPKVKNSKIKHFNSTMSLDSNLSECSVILERIKEDEIKLSSENLEMESKENLSGNVQKNNEATVKNKSQSINDITVEKESRLNKDITLTVDENKKDDTEKSREDLIANIIKLDTAIKEERAELHSLRQAVIYKKKHDIEDLKKLTTLWRNGCHDALHDLLAKLKEIMQSDMTMEKLLKQLDIPDSMIQYDSIREEFVNIC